MLMKDFVRWVFKASLIAIPVSYLLARRWLCDFACQAERTILSFLLALFAALLIAALAVSSQAVRAAVRNPMESLKRE